MTIKDFGIDRLPPADRLRLAEEIWDSLADADALPALTDAQKQELSRRSAELDAHPDRVLTWDQIKARVLGGP